MINRFRNALYGTSGANDDSTVGMDDDFRDSMPNSRVRSALTRSSSFREDLLNGGLRTRIASTNIDKNKNISHTGNRNQNGNYDTSMYSQNSPKQKSDRSNSHNSCMKQLKFPYQRPDFLLLKTDDEIMVSADHQIRPVLLPRVLSRLPWRTGYAECINAGKSLRNEDQAVCYQGIAIAQKGADNDEIVDQLPVPIYRSIPWTYFAVFDGHAGSAVAIAAANQLHHLIADKLNSVAARLINLEFGSEDEKICDEMDARKTDATMENQDVPMDEKNVNDETGFHTTAHENQDKCDQPVDRSKTNKCDMSARNSNVTLDMAKKERGIIFVGDNVMDKMIGGKQTSLDDLINGALESAFWEMDAQIGNDKRYYKMPGGCTAIVSLFMLGKLYVCNAGDSRAVLIAKSCGHKLMSNDFTPVSERERIARLGLQCPELLCDTFTQVQYHPRHPLKTHIGTKMLYRDAYMTGFALKTITHDDLKYPLVCGEGKRSRLLATIGVTRGFGDHEMCSQYGSVPIKPFLTPEPEVIKYDIESADNITPEDVLILATDGLWDVTTPKQAEQIVNESFELFPESISAKYPKYRYITVAQDLIINARGSQAVGHTAWTRRTDGTYASHDDISLFVIPLQPYKQEYQQWKQARFEALTRALESSEDMDFRA